MNRRLSQRIVGLATTTLFLAACGVPAATPTPTFTPTPAPTYTPLPSPTPTHTPTSTPSPLPTATRTATPLPTRTPGPPTSTPSPTSPPTPQPQPTAVPGLSRLSGLWEGTTTLFYLGSFPVHILRLGEPQPVWMTWTVDDAGNVTIWESGWEGNWSGRVEPNLNVSIQRTFTYYVGDQPETRTTLYNSTIRNEGGTYVLEMEGIEEWSPPDYVFRRVYSLQKRP